MTCKRDKDIRKVSQALDKYNIHWKRNFGCIPTQHQAFSDMNIPQGTFPSAEWVGDNGLHIGCHFYLSDEDLERMCNALREGLLQCTPL